MKTNIVTALTYYTHTYLYVYIYIYLRRRGVAGGAQHTHPSLLSADAGIVFLLHIHHAHQSFLQRVLYMFSSQAAPPGEVYEGIERICVSLASVGAAARSSRMSRILSFELINLCLLLGCQTPPPGNEDEKNIKNQSELGTKSQDFFESVLGLSQPELLKGSCCRALSLAHTPASWPT